MRRKIILPAILLTGALAVGSLGFTRAYAQENSTYPPIVEKLAEKFGLNRDEVLDVFEEHRDDRKAEMFANFSERLDDLVAEGKITSEQKEKILDKHEEVQTKMESLKDLDPQERKAQMQAFHEELKKWAEENNIDFPFMVFRSIGPGFKHGFKAGMMFGEKLD